MARSLGLRNAWLQGCLLFWAGGFAGLAIGSDVDQLASLRTEAAAFEHGEGVPRDPQRAVLLYCQCAKQGDAEAQYRLGWMYANGRGVPRDDAMAAYFFSLASAQAHPAASRMLRYVGDTISAPPKCMVDESDDAAWIAESDTPMRRQIVELVNRLAPEYGVSPRLALAIIRAESNFDPAAVSTKNAQGVMQLIPETAVRFNVKKPFDPEQNIRGGLAYLRWLLAYFKGDVSLVAAAYNAGEGAVNRFAGIPPFAETRGYVKRIRELFRNDEHPYDASIVEPSPELPRIRARVM